MGNVVVLVMHGSPPRDFPRQETAEFFGLASRLRQAGGPERAAMQQRHSELEAKMRAWPRTPENDPFHAASLEMAAALRKATGDEVMVAFGEFCAPTMDEALDQAASLKSGRVIVITPMMTRGGEHSEADIPAAVRRAEEHHPAVPFTYVWPYDLADVVGFLSGQIRKFVSQP